MTDPLRLLVIGLNYAPEPVGIGPFTSGLATALAARGHAVDVVAGQPYYPQWRKLPGHSGWQTSIAAGVRITRCPHYVPARPGGLKRVLHLVSFAISALAPALKAAGRRPQAVLCVAPALLSVPVAWLAARRAGAALWIHVQDFEVEAALATGLVRPGPLGRLARWLENRLLRLGTCVSSISPQMCARLADKGVPTGRVVELRNWANVPEICAEGGASYRAEWGLGLRKVALYSGNIANKQGIEVVIEAARLLAHRDDLAFVICGEGPNRARLADLAAGLPNVLLKDLQPADRLGELLALAHVHLLPQIAGAADLVLPSKLANMLASGRPVVATAAAGTGLAEEVEGCGLVVPPGHAEALSDAIVELADDPAKAEALGQAGAARAAQRWSQQAVADEAAAVLAALAAVA